MEKNKTINEIHTTTNVNRESIILEQKLSDFEEKSKRVDLLQILKSSNKDLANLSKEQAENLMSNANLHLFMKVNDEEIQKKYTDTTMTDESKKLFIDESDDNNLMNLYDKRILSSRKHNGNIDEIVIKTSSIIESSEIAKVINNHIEDCNPIEMEIGQRKEQFIDDMLHRESDIILLNPDYSKTEKVHIPLTGEVPELETLYSDDIKNKINPKFTKENDELLGKTIDNYFMNRQLGRLSETGKMAMERIFREARRYSAMPHRIINDDTYTSYPVSKPFLEEKQIPTEREFKEEAKRLKNSDNFSSLGAAQNELAKRYGFNEYRAIKSIFSKSLNSYDNIRVIFFNPSELNDNERNELHNFILRFNSVFRKLNISVGILESYMNKEPRAYYKILEQLQINENSLIGNYRYFLTENSIVFGQIKKNISILSQDRKINLLNDLNDLEINENDAPAFGLFANLLSYHLGKSAGDVTLHKNEDGTIEQRFVPKSSSGAMKKSLNDEVFDFLKHNINSTKLLNEIAANQVLTELKEDFAYKTTKGFFIYFINNIAMENRLTADIIRKISNEVPIGSKIECNQFSYDMKKGNVLNVIAMDFQPTNILVEKLYKIASAINSASKRPGIGNALINILSNKELKIDSDDNIKVNISNSEILDSMGISQSKEKGFNRAKETLKNFGLKPNKDGDYEYL